MWYDNGEMRSDEMPCHITDEKTDNPREGDYEAQGKPKLLTVKYSTTGTVEGSQLPDNWHELDDQEQKDELCDLLGDVHNEVTIMHHKEA